MKLWSLTIFAFLCGCSANPAAQFYSEMDATNCTGELKTFGLTGTSLNSEDLEAVVLPGFLKNTFEIHIVEQPIRLSICLSDDLTSASVKTADAVIDNEVIHFDEQQLKRQEGLMEALFGDTSTLLLQFEKNPTESLFIAGQSEIDGLAIAALVKPGETGQFDSTAAVHIGLFELVPQVAANGCLEGETFDKAEFTIGTARFKTSYCAHPTPDRSTAITLLSLSVTDTNETLSDEWRSKTIDIPKDQLKGVYHWTHHNWEDRFELSLPHVTYSAQGHQNFMIVRRIDWSVTYPAKTETGIINGCAEILLCEKK